MMKQLIYNFEWLSPPQLIRSAQEGAKICLTLGMLCCLAALWSRFSCPQDSLHGIYVKYIFCHVPAALNALIFYSISTFLAFFYALWPMKWAYLGIEATLWPTLFLAFWVLISGICWGGVSWGTFWVWDMRLTSFLMLFIFVSFLLTLIGQKKFSHHKKARQILSFLVMFGFLDVLLTHFSVQWFHTLHQGSSFSWNSKSTIDWVFLWRLYLHFFGLFLVCSGLSLTIFYKKTSSIGI